MPPYLAISITVTGVLRGYVSVAWSYMEQRVVEKAPLALLAWWWASDDKSNLSSSSRCAGVPG